MGVDAPVQTLADKVTDFIYEHAPYKDKDVLRERVQKHLVYKTCRVLIDEHNMVAAVCMFNISNNGEVAFITDVTIRKDYSGKDFMRNTLLHFMKFWPLKYLIGDRTNEKGIQIGHRKIWSVERFLRRRV
jgi:hypothetical protein